MPHRAVQMKGMRNKPLSKQEELNYINIKNYKLYYNNPQVAKDIYDEIFCEKIYDFEASRPDPFIIDAGSNIGLSVLYFKLKYPLAKILCFEPDPIAFSILEKNITENNLKHVSLINAALSNKDGLTYLFGEITGSLADARGNSIIEAWGKQRINSSSVLVRAKQLSEHVNQEVDFLKMDIEGAEQQVLEELGSKLQHIKQMVFEVHETSQLNSINNSETISNLLRNAGFECTITEKQILNLLPKEIEQWIMAEKPKFYIAEARRLS